MIDVQKAHFWIFFINSEKTKILDQNIFLLRFHFTQSFPIILKYILDLYMVLIPVYIFSQYLHPKGTKFSFFFFIKFFEGMVEISAQKCAFWVQILYKIHISKSIHLSAHFTFGSCQKIQSITKVMKQYVRVRKNYEIWTREGTKIFTRHFQCKKLLC